MKTRSIFVAIAMISIVASIFSILPIKGQATDYGPRVPELLVRIYLTADAEFQALKDGIVDITDWPAPSEWVSKFAGDPTIRMPSYAEIGHMEIDLNVQRWPTGVEMPREYDPMTSTYKHWYGTSEWDDEARQFRVATAHLLNKGKIETDILKGTGVRQETNVPTPALEGYTDFDDLQSKGLIHNYDPIEAQAILTAAGFTLGSTPNTEPGAYVAYMRTDPRNAHNDLAPLTFYIRMDDPQRRDAGRLLTAELRKSGIPVTAIETEKTVCFKNVMVLYDYNLYTGGWSTSADAPNSLFDFDHSSQYWGGTETSSYAGLGWSGQYNGAAHNFTKDDGLADWYDVNKNGIKDQQDYVDYWTSMSKYAPKFRTSDPGPGIGVYDAGLKAQEVTQWLCPEIPMFCATSSKPYRIDKWGGVVNVDGYGVDDAVGWPWSLVNMYNKTNGDTRIDYGFKSNLEGPNIITSEWVWDAQASSYIMYDTLISRNPYNLAEEFGYLAKSWVKGTSGNQIYIDFTLRDNPRPKWHNGDLVTAADVKFSLEFTRACGPGVSWGYSTVMDIDHVDVISETVARVWFRPGVESYWATHWAGFTSIMSKNIWMAANIKYGWGYTDGLVDYKAFAGRIKVREYNPWTSDVDADGVTDMTEDGSGPWIWRTYSNYPGSISAAESIAFVANNPGREVIAGKLNAPGFYLSQEYISNYLNWAFHMKGDVNDDGKIDGVDQTAIFNAFGTNKLTSPLGEGFDQYNFKADINTGSWNMETGQYTYGDGVVNTDDHTKWGKNFGKSPG